MFSFEERQNLKRLISEAYKAKLINGPKGDPRTRSNERQMKERIRRRMDEGLEPSGDGYRCKACDKYTNWNGYKRNRHHEGCPFLEEQAA